MKKIIYTLLFISICCYVEAQDRYVDEMFAVEKTSGITYGSNISVLLGGLQDLKMDIYSPVGDTETSRPVVLIAPTGSFLPVVFNQTTSGSLTDSSVVEIATRLAARGYVAAVYDYRKGWLPTSPEADVRKGTLLQAAYRGIQDTRTAIRFFRRNVDEGGNTYGVNPDQVGVWGIGTGGYLALGAGSLDDISEVTLDKFLASNGDPLIDEATHGNIDGTTVATLNVPNHVGYSSDFSFSFNAGGALGDASWFDGAANEPAYTGVHCPQDLFAPYYAGLVIVPTTNEIVVDVAGTRLAIETANDLGSNDPIAGIIADDDPLQDLIEAQKNSMVTAQIAQQQPVTVQTGVDNFYAFNIPLIFNGAPAPQGSPWDWWGLDDLRNLVAAINSTIPDMADHFNADALHASSLQTNPDMSAEKARLYIDTIFMLNIPRMYVAMELGDAITAVEDIISASEVGLEASPNPSSDFVNFTANDDKSISHLQVFDINGKLVSNTNNINQNNYAWYRNNLPAGVYVAKVYFEEGIVTKKLIIE